MFTKKSAKIRSEFVCINCNYTTCDKKDYNKHIATAKHKNNTNVDILLTASVKKSELLAEIICNCGKKYKSRQGLYAHKKKCNFLQNAKVVNGSNSELALTNDLIINLLNDNKDMREIIIKQQDHMMKQQNQISEMLPKLGNNNFFLTFQ